jgi:glycosyltransferase involved in cell wall biosynthesis
MVSTLNNFNVSVVIPVINAETIICRCLEAVFSQSHHPDEVIVVDGHSSDRTVEMASKYPVKIVYENYGTVGGARQVGLENSKGEYVAFTDADCIPEKNWLENLLKGFKEGAVGVGGCVKNTSTDGWGQAIALTADTFLGSANSVQGRMFKKKCVVKSISGCNSMYRKKDLQEIGGFNVSLSINEETELNKRLSKLGYLIYVPDAVILHNQDRNLKAFAKRMFQFGDGRGKLRLWDLQCIPPLIAVVLLASLFFTIRILVSALCLYFITLVIFGLKFAIKEKNIGYLGSVPITYVVEHCSYSLGFLRGLLKVSQ